jgi:hypothetical protein
MNPIVIENKQVAKKRTQSNRNLHKTNEIAGIIKMHLIENKEVLKYAISTEIKRPIEGLFPLVWWRNNWCLATAPAGASRRHEGIGGLPLASPGAQTALCLAQQF